MKKYRTNHSLPTTMFGLGTASLETIARRSAMMAMGTCSAAEYQRMVREKMAAAMQSSLLLASWPPATPMALLAPWHRAARANARRLRRRSG